MKKTKSIALLVSYLLASEAGAAEIRSKTGIRVQVADAAQTRLQCVVGYVEARGIKIKSMRGRGYGTVSGSLHPSGRALDINQTARGRTSPHVPHLISNGAADACGVISGARWRDGDNGHWNLKR